MKMIRILMIFIYSLCTFNLQSAEEKEGAEKAVNLQQLEKLIQEKIAKIPSEYKNTMIVAGRHLKNALDSLLALKITMSPAQIQSRFGVIFKDIDDFNGLISDKKFGLYFEKHPELVIAMKEMQSNAAAFLLNLQQFFSHLALEAQSNNQLEKVYNRLQNKWMENIKGKVRAALAKEEQPRLTSEGKMRVYRTSLDNFLENHFHELETPVGQLFE